MQLLTKVDISEWQEYLLKELTQKLGNKVMFALIVTKINNRTIFKDSNKMIRQVYNPKKESENIGVHVETIKSQ